MKKIFRYATAAAAVVTMFISCTVDELENGNSITEGECITAILNSAQDAEQTRMDHVVSNYTMSTYWAVNDYISVVPDGYKYNVAGLFKLVAGAGGSTATFQAQTSVGASSSQYKIFYPGDVIKSYSQFLNRTYTGQVQKKSQPMAHLSRYHTLCKTASSYSTVDFTDCDQSACMHFSLSGMTFKNPSKITLTAMVSNIPMAVFCENNVNFESFTYYVGDEYDGKKPVSSLSLDLEGYGNESNIEAYMMMSNDNVNLPSGYTLRVKVQCSDDEYYADVKVNSSMSLVTACCHCITITNGWMKSSAAPATSPYDGKVYTLQTHSVGNGIDLVLMGDGYTETDIANNTYDTHMREAYANFFSILPQSALKNYFNVYYVTAVSEEHINAINDSQNGATNTGAVTIFNTQFTAGSTNVVGNNDVVYLYARKAFSSNADQRLKDATIIVLANQNCRAGTCHQSYELPNAMDYGHACAIAYCALGRNTTERQQLIRHEAAGHGYGKLADEYAGQNDGYNSGWWNDLNNLHQIGISRNVSMHVDDYIYGIWGTSLGLTLTTKSNVYWHDLFGTANNYETTEGLGIYVGANTHNAGFCRPTQNGENSIMNKNTGIFNAPSRRAIIYRTRRLSGEVSSNSFGTSSELNYFLNWDATVFLPTRSAVRGEVNPPLLEAGNPMNSPQVMHEGRWEDGKFIEERSFTL